MGGTTTRENPRQKRPLSRSHDSERDRASLCRPTVGCAVVSSELPLYLMSFISLEIKLKIKLILHTAEQKYNKYLEGKCYFYNLYNTLHRRYSEKLKSQKKCDLKWKNIRLHFFNLPSN